MRKFLENIFGQTDSNVESRVDQGNNLHIATAALLIEIAAVDDEFAEDERQAIVANLKQHFSLSDDEVEEILEMTKAELERRIDMYYFTRQLNEHYSIEDKIKVIEMVWRVVFTDRHLNGLEDFLVHRFGKLLNLDHRKLIEAKLRVKSEIG